MTKQKYTEDIEITWEVSDGYVGKSRPQKTTIPSYELEFIESEEELEDFIEEWVQTEFENKISWDITRVEGID